MSEVLPWQRETVAQWVARRGTWPHALIVTGRRGIGKRALADALAAALLCERPRADGAACGECPSCGYVRAGQHPDFFVVEPVKLDDEGNAKPQQWIEVDAIRALTAWSQVTSHRGGARVALLDPAERMNASAANALLKTLEEPPADTFLILVASQPGRLPATVLSRCQRLVAPQPSASDARAWLVGRGVAEPDSALARAGFAPLAALALAGSDSRAERERWLGAFADPAGLSVAAWGARIEQVPRELRRDCLVAVVEWLDSWCTDLARVRAGAPARFHPDLAGELAALAKSVAPRALFRYHRNLMRTRAALAQPLQPRLVAEAVLIDYRKLFVR
jgi:DNA polymerase-3 subunit delta'